MAGGQIFWQKVPKQNENRTTIPIGQINSDQWSINWKAKLGQLQCALTQCKSNVSWVFDADLISNKSQFNSKSKIFSRFYIGMELHVLPSFIANVINFTEQNIKCHLIRCDQNVKKNVLQSEDLIKWHYFFSKRIIAQLQTIQ